VTKYAVKVPMGEEEDDMLFVTEGDTKFKLRIKTFNTISEAYEHAHIWGPHSLVVELDDDYEINL
jgi:hypothetical protein